MPMQETGNQALGKRDPLEKDMATHSSVIAREIPQQAMSILSQRVDTTQKLNNNNNFLKQKTPGRKAQEGGDGYMYTYS